MDIPTGFIQKLSALKNNSAILVSIISALAAGLLLIPTHLMSSRLKKQMEKESITKGIQIKSLSARAVSGEQWKKAAERQLAYANDANQLELLLKQSSQRELLSYNIFPAPKDTSTLIFEEFGQLYRKALEDLIAGLNARDCPTDTELQRALEGSSANLRSSRISRRSNNEVADQITDEICRERAESISVYAKPASLSGYEYWEGYQYNVGIEKSVEDCWYHQLSYWVIEDVIDTIGACNAGSENVLTSPVKRLLAVQFSLGKGRLRRTGRSSGRRTSRAIYANDRPSYVLSFQDALIEPCTGRLCNDDMDVIHFNVIVLVNAEEVLPFMQQLCSAKEHKFAGYSADEQEQPFKHNQITILESTMRSIDRGGPDHLLYCYGEDAVVELDLNCEYIFSKKAYDEMKPESVKNSQKVVATSTGR